MTPPNTDPLPPVLQVVAGALVVGKKVLIGRRLVGGSSGGQWEFPGGKVEPGETHQEALVREFAEELNATVEVDRWLARSEVVRKDHQLYLDLFLLQLQGNTDTIQKRAHSSIAWADSTDLGSFDWASADRPFLDVVLGILDPGSIRRSPS